MANKNSRVLATGSNQITQHYGNAGHGGCDLVKKTNQLDAITAHSDGTVVWCQSGIPNDQGSSGNRSYGNAVKLRHASGWCTLYAHMDYISVKNGQTVRKGQKLGYMGNTGNSYGAHLHFEVRDKSDSAVGGQFVTSVSQTDGVVSVTRAALQASDIPALGVDKITGLQTALDSKASADALSTTDGKVTTLIGDDAAKSVRTIANEELAAQLIPEGAAESLNTLQEIAAWIQEHPDDASAMNSAITALQAQLTGIGSGSGTVKAYVDAAISALNIGDYITASALAAAIGNLDVDDAAVEGQVVSAVSEVDGKIKVSRRALAAADIPTLAVDKISGLQTALDSKVNSDALADVATSGKIEDLSQDTYIVLNCGSSSVNV